MINQKLSRWFIKTSAARLLASGFALVILAGAVLLWMPFSLQPGIRISFLQALFEAASAVCVTGLTVVPVGQTFNVFGRTVMAVLIQIGGMGIVLLGISLILLARGKPGFKTRSLFVQAQNLFGYSELVMMAKRIIAITFSIEIAGALLVWPVFAKDYPLWKALGYACFHSISAFNNAGFDILGGYDSLAAYANDPAMNLVTCLLVILGGFGFIALLDVFQCRGKWSHFLLTTKIAALMTGILLFGGTVLLKITTSQTWMEAFFQSVIARTAGFSTYSLSNFSQAGILVFIVLMFIGANPNSTGGGVKTTTVYVAALKAYSATAEHDEDSVFHRRIPQIVFAKAFIVLFFGMMVVLIGSFLLLICEPDASLQAVLVEVTSAFATVGSSMGLTPTLGPVSQIVLIICMFIGRVGPVTIANLLVTKQEKSAQYTEESVLIG